MRSMETFRPSICPFSATADGQCGCIQPCGFWRRARPDEQAPESVNGPRPIAELLPLALDTIAANMLRADQ